MIRSRTFGSLVCLVLFGCSTDRAPLADPTLRSDSAGVSIIETAMSDDAPLCDASGTITTFGNDPAEPESQLYGVWDATLLPDGRLALINVGTNQIKFFDPDGSFSGQFGRRGDGPGEFLANQWNVTFLPPDTLVVGESRTWRWSYFTTQGNFLRAVEPVPHMIERPEVTAVLPNAAGSLIGMACCYPDEGFAMRMLTLGHYGPDGILQDTVAVFPYERGGYLDREIGYIGPPIFASTGALAVLSDTSFAYASGEGREVGVYHLDGSLLQSIRWSGPDRRVAASDVAEWRRQLREARGEDAPASPFFDATVSTDRPVADSFPAHDGLLAGGDGTLWVKQFRRPTETGPDSWLVFSSDGALRCRAVVPGELRVFEADADYILGTYRDQLDVEYVVKRELTAPISGAVQ